MQRLFASLVGIIVCAVGAVAGDAGKGKNVEYVVHNGHFENNNSGLTGASSYLVFTDRAAFDKVFGVAAIMAKQNFVPQDAFNKKMVVAVIKRGNALTDYKVTKVAAEGDSLQVQYTAKAKAAGGATFASPLIISVNKNNYKSVDFIENGKKVDTVKVGN